MRKEKPSVTKTLDAIVIGAGVSGLYALHKLRELGLSTRVFEAGTDIGGTWYWNRYPGARFDSESYTYQYSFSQELLDEWEWTEHFAAQPEIERYLHFVADKFDLKRDIELNARVRTARYDEAEKLWEIETESGIRASAPILIAATGLLSAHQLPDYEGVEEFGGMSLHTARWPKEEIDLRGKRVGVIGSGPTAVQVIQEVASQAEHLTVFQRTANWCTPLRNRPIDPEEQRELKERAHEIFDICKRTFAGFIHGSDSTPGADVPKAERMARYQELYDRGGFALWLGNYSETFTSAEIAGEVSEFLADKIRERVKDPEMAEKLIPKSHTFGTKRCPGERDYYEQFNRDNVTLVDLRATPIKKITKTGIDTDTETHDLDVIIYATGFQALTGELMRLEILGEGGRSLREHWSDGPKTNLGVQFSGFPNLFAVMGPHNPATFCNITRCIENNVDWIVNCIRYMRENGFETIKTTVEAEEAWTQRCYDSLKGLLIEEMQDSWFFGTNNDENVRGRFLLFAGGVPLYREIFADVAAKGYEGFELQ
ncbi:MAG: NAD(P)/FAD-dependent oxidoreductase [Myxococcales bacterium]|nr:NAD(P)/FAD-dependent oxidoreductase [Myxococcales bacterium]